MSIRFYNSDRQQVIDLLDKHFDAYFIKLPGAKFQKLLTDQKSRRIVLIFGGTGNWHGMGVEFMDAVSRLIQDGHKGYVVLVEKQIDRLDIFAGPLDVFVKEKDELIRNQDGDYQFHHERYGNKITFKESSSLELALVGTV